MSGVERLRAIWTFLRERVAQRNRRERGLLLATLVVALVGGWYALHFEEWVERLDEAQATERAALNEAARHEARIEALEEELAADPDDLLREEIDELQASVGRLEERIAEKAPEFIDPVRMRSVLEGLLRGQEGARLRAAESFPAEQLFVGEEDETAIYRHRLRLVFEADFHGALEYLRAVEQLPWRLAWQRLDYRVEEHPRARVEILIHTLSGHEAWIGV